MFDGHRVDALVGRFGTPSYVYSTARITANVAGLLEALDATGCSTRLIYAMKANRFPGVLEHVRQLGLGLDVCSPGEVRHALACGFTLNQLSFTAGSLSTADYAALSGWPELWINADSRTALRRLAEVSPGREIGLRINPAVGLGYADNPLVRYAANARPTKFGVHAAQFADALALAHDLGLRVTGLHCHAGSGFLTPQLPALDEVLTRIGSFLDAAPSVRRLNLGGGLGIPLVSTDAPLDRAAWAALIRRHLAPRGLSLTFEPGDHIVKDAGILLTEITQVELKSDVTFVGVNAGFNLHPEPAFYRMPLEPVPALRRTGDPTEVTIIGNINEALDVWCPQTLLPPVEERDTLVFINAGAYGASMASAHCLRTEMTEHLLPPAPESATSPIGLDATNRFAWNELYSSTAELVWGREPMPFLEAYRAEIAAVLTDPVRLLDAGTGEGRNLPFLVAFNAGEVTGLDSSQAALDKVPAEIRERVVLRHAALDGTGLPDASFDMVLLLDVVETLPNAEQVLRELNRVLKPGGLLLCNIAATDDGVAGIDMHPTNDAGEGFLYQNRYYFRFFNEEQATALMTGAGFEPVSCRSYTWEEESHPEFRAETHSHTSHVMLVRRPLAITG